MTNPPAQKSGHSVNAQGRGLMQQRQLDEAIAYFRQAWQTAGLVAALNNWAPPSTTRTSRPKRSRCWTNCRTPR